ncbi:hypothetical protein PIB30_072559 [Stylosanthes scabra]|uniref:Uncharacterized protein n=1 Tax=Stylosanthes scabra TaxID=79078 RepID=A0ABU6YPG4_9FABA|nr:hypothetical protein [Stylosanthes scabra]
MAGQGLSLKSHLVPDSESSRELIRWQYLTEELHSPCELIFQRILEQREKEVILITMEYTANLPSANTSFVWNGNSIECRGH